MFILRDYQKQAVLDVKNAFRQGKRRVCVVLGCGGGKSIIIAEIARQTTALHHRVMFLVHRQELINQITATFKGHDVDLGYCDILMMQTGTRHLPDYQKPDLIIVDEAHHVKNRSYMRILDYYGNVPVVGFTATPARMNEGGLGDVFDDLIKSVSTRWLIQNKFLAPVKCYGVQLADASKVHVRQGDYKKDEIQELMDKPVIYGRAVDNWLKIANGKKTIVYCSSVKTSEATAAAYVAAGIPAAHIDAKTPQAERLKMVMDFRQGLIKILCNVDLFGEGFDVPNCECVQLLRPTRSLTLHIQQSMRSMRIDPENPDKVALVLDHVGNINLHGLPDTDYEWSLDPKTKKQRAVAVPIKQCPNCYSWVKRIANTCPDCGHVFKTEHDREYKVVNGVMLTEISGSADPGFYWNYQLCKTYRELELFAKARNYKFGWAIRRAIEAGIRIPKKYRYWCFRQGLVALYE